MEVRKINVYYCDFCGAHRLSKRGIEFHEKHCTKNANRECRLCFDYDSQPDYHELVAEVRETPHESLMHSDTRDAMWDYLKAACNDCPGCIMTVLRLSGRHDIRPDGWDWDAECKKRVGEQWEQRRNEGGW